MALKVALLALSTVALAQEDSCPAGGNCGHTCYLMVGNPGVGKSTILNGYAGKALFQSGMSFGKGLTSVLQEETIGSSTYIDTPGLADLELRKQAAQAIETALKRGNCAFKVFFVVTLEAGRVKPADKTTMELVLKAAPIKDYAVIINKLDTEELEMILSNDDQARDHVVMGLMEGLPAKTVYWHFALRTPRLSGKRNQAMSLDDDFKKFIKMVPVNYIPPEKVQTISIQDYEALSDRFETMIATLAKNSQLLEEKMQRDAAEYRRLLDEQSKKNEMLTEALRRATQPAPARTPDKSTEGK